MLKNIIVFLIKEKNKRELSALRLFQPPLY